MERRRGACCGRLVLCAIVDVDAELSNGVYRWSPWVTCTAAECGWLARLLLTLHKGVLYPSATRASRAWACRVVHAVCAYRRSALTRPSQDRGNPVIGLRATGDHTYGCARQSVALWFTIMLGRGKARRWWTRQTRCTSSRRTLPGAAEVLGPGSAQSRSRTLKRAGALTLLRGLKPWVPAPKGPSLMARDIMQ
jgi:hypothetical protein